MEERKKNEIVKTESGRVLDEIWRMKKDIGRVKKKCKGERRNEWKEKVKEERREWKRESGREKEDGWKEKVEKARWKKWVKILRNAEPNMTWKSDYTVLAFNQSSP